MPSPLLAVLLATMLATPPAAPGGTEPPADKPAEKPAETKPADKPAERPAEKPAETKPADKPAEKPQDPKPAQPKPSLVSANDIVHVKAQEGLPRQKFTFFGETFDCELCLTPDSRNAGMGVRGEFPAGTAMIFVHPEPSYLSYWMKDCLIDLDMVMVDKQGIICAMHAAKRERLRTKLESLQQYHDRLRRYTSNRYAQFVVELPAGTIARLKPSLGQRIDIDWKSLAARAE